MGLVTLNRRTFVFTFVSLAVLGVATAIVLLYPATFYSFTCEQFDLPEYEKAYGFTFSEVPILRPDGSTRYVAGISAVDPREHLAALVFGLAMFQERITVSVTFVAASPPQSRTARPRSTYSTCMTRKPERSPGVTFCSGCPNSPITVPSNNALERTRRVGVPRLRGAIVRVSPRRSTQCYARLRMAAITNER